MGLEPVWKRARVVLVSNGGALFTFGSSRNWIMRLLRYNTVTGNQAGDMRKRWLITSFMRGDLQGTYWDIGSAPAHPIPPATAPWPEWMDEEKVSRALTNSSRRTLLGRPYSTPS
ncbi:MAG TPA: hypothetical protein VER55_12365 [Ardenticatenaceae bacterium]|nr:hypothetical protein [Ardenticatenaceae bacterium]